VVFVIIVDVLLGVFVGVLIVAVVGSGFMVQAAFPHLLALVR